MPHAKSYPKCLQIHPKLFFRSNKWFSNEFIDYLKIRGVRAFFVWAKTYDSKKWAKLENSYFVWSDDSFILTCITWPSYNIYCICIQSDLLCFCLTLTAPIESNLLVLKLIINAQGYRYVSVCVCVRGKNYDLWHFLEVSNITQLFCDSEPMCVCVIDPFKSTILHK